MTQNYKTYGKMGYMLFCEGAIVDMIKSERVCLVHNQWTKASLAG